MFTFTVSPEMSSIYVSRVGPPFSIIRIHLIMAFSVVFILLLLRRSGWPGPETVLPLYLRTELFPFDLFILQTTHNPIVRPLPVRLPVDVALKLSL